MPKSILVDINVVLDILLGRPGQEYSKSVLEMGEAGLVEMCVSVHSVTTFAYILESSKVAQNEILRQVDWLLHMFTVVPVDVDILQQALRSKVKDYEDAVVERAAILAGAECIVTRNAKDFKQSQVRAVLPKVFLSETK